MGTITIADNPASIDADTLTLILGSYLREIKPEAFAKCDDRDADLAAEILVAGQLDKIRTETSDYDSPYVDNMTTTEVFGLGVKFGVEAAAAVMHSPPNVALQDVKGIFYELKASLQTRIDKMLSGNAKKNGARQPNA